MRLSVSVEVTPNTTIIRKPTCTERTIWLGSGLKVAVTIWKAENATAIQNSARPSKSWPQPFSSRASVLVWPGIGVPGPGVYGGDVNVGHGT